MLAGDHSKHRNREQGCTHSTDWCCLLMFKKKDPIDPSSQPPRPFIKCVPLAWYTRPQKGRPFKKIVKEVDLAVRNTPEPVKGTLGVCGVGLGPQLSDGAWLNTWCVAEEQSFWEGIKG